jgi:G:T-mismatch repair DNA endonuclease (very short patch repair protein)
MREKRLAGMRSPEARAKQRASWNSRPTGPERRVMSVLDELELPYEYEPRLGRLKPDFVVAGALVVEVFGCFWHACESCGFADTNGARQRDAARVETLLRHHPVLVIWEHELDDPGAMKTRIQDEVDGLTH